jgi:hypothetical protein
MPSNGPWTHLGSPKDWGGTWIWSAMRSTRLLAVGALNSPRLITCQVMGPGLTLSPRRTGERDLDLVSKEVHQAVGTVGSRGSELTLVNHMPSNGPWTHRGSPKDWGGTWIWSAMMSTRLLAVGALNSPRLITCQVMGPGLTLAPRRTGEGPGSGQQLGPPGCWPARVS